MAILAIVRNCRILVPSCFRLATKIANLSLFWALGSSAFSLVLVQSLMILSLDFFRHLAFYNQLDLAIFLVAHMCPRQAVLDFDHVVQVGVSIFSSQYLLVVLLVQLIFNIHASKAKFRKRYSFEQTGQFANCFFADIFKMLAAVESSPGALLSFVSFIG